MGRIIRPIELTTRGVRDLKKLKSFNTKLYGKIKSQKIVATIFRELELLESGELDTSEIGAIDKDFSHLKGQYRKMIVKHCKITYRVGRTKLYVVRVFDTRQHPGKNK